MHFFVKKDVNKVKVKPLKSAPIRKSLGLQADVLKMDKEDEKTKSLVDKYGGGIKKTPDLRLT